MKTKQIVEKCGMLLDLILNPSESDKIQKAANRLLVFWIQSPKRAADRGTTSLEG